MTQPGATPTEPQPTREQMRQEWFRLRRDVPSDPRVAKLEAALLQMPGDPDPEPLADELILMREISDGLGRVAGTMRILVAVRLLESGQAPTWIEAVRMARNESEAPS